MRARFPHPTKLTKIRIASLYGAALVLVTCTSHGICQCGLLARLCLGRFAWDESLRVETGENKYILYIIRTHTNRCTLAFPFCKEISGSS